MKTGKHAVILPEHQEGRIGDDKNNRYAKLSITKNELFLQAFSVPLEETKGRQHKQELPERH